MGTTPEQEDIAALRMSLAEKLTSTSKSLERNMRNFESLLKLLQTLQQAQPDNAKIDEFIKQAQIGVASMNMLNNQVRRMNT